MPPTHSDPARSDPARPPRREAAFVRAVYGGEPFLVNSALAAGILTRQDLRTRFRRLHPRVYVRASAELDPAQKIRAAWLWGGPRSVICGGAAGHLAGEAYFGEELVRDEVQLWRPTWRRAPPGIVVRKWTATPDHLLWQGMAVTTPARTAIDLARHMASDVRAVAALDSMCRTGGTDPDAIAAAAFAMAGQTGVRRVLGLLPAVDPLAESPKESELRLIMGATDLPVFESQVEVRDESGALVSRLDLGNRRWKVGLQYDGNEHLTRARRDGDSVAMLRLASLGWEVRRVTQGLLHTPRTLTRFVRGAFEKQGWEHSV
ncbi:MULTISPECIES: hypothetical protein [Dietzia]|uniref:DUF559 domain-containing protein n=1 Tax=Dietzia cercidiphylli TaxID=498199 RepID=A0ABN2J369_9ACTN|nr:MULTISPECIES: hypothetical protein [Dietzia]MBB1047703.1 hypothetical protein [Dietzia cercidiphylli]MBB1052359.1 hypothetical protein [Dietzia sp. CW19]MBB1057826.1 hypothetical protein [Dietzia sp. B19]